jgi:hypothetical protein
VAGLCELDERSVDAVCKRLRRVVAEEPRPHRRLEDVERERNVGGVTGTQYW